VFRESLACGTPFVSTDVGSISEIASPEYSLLARKGDSEDLSRAMLEILNVRFQLGVQNYRSRSWTDCASEMVDVLAGVSSSSGPSEQSPCVAVRAGNAAGDLITAAAGCSRSVMQEGAVNATYDS
jgi:teichuronic acid biosynthesis glycosyltransferase TuaC